MILTNDEKRTIRVAAAGGAVVLLIYFAVLPLWNRWTALGAALEPKVLLLDKLAERASAQNALLARRDALARELGAVEGRAAPVGPAQGAPPSSRPPAAPPSGVPSPKAPMTAAASAAADRSHQARPTPQVLIAPGAAPPSPAAPPRAVSVAAYVERQAATAGIRFNSVTPFSPSRGFRSGKSLMPVGVVVTLDTVTPSFLRLLYALEKGGRLLRIEDMEIHRDLKKGPAITATLRLVGYEAAAR